MIRIMTKVGRWGMKIDRRKEGENDDKFKNHFTEKRR